MKQPIRLAVLLPAVALSTVALVTALGPMAVLATSSEGSAFEHLSAPVQKAVQSLTPKQIPKDLVARPLPGNKTLVEFDKDGIRYRLLVSNQGEIDQIQETISYRPVPESGRNDAIGAVASLHEDLIELAMAGERSAMQEKLTSIGQSLSSIRSALDEKTIQTTSENLKKMEQSLRSDDWPALSLAAVDNFKQLEMALDKTALTAPLEVALLDYAGFKLKALAGSAKPDWALATRTVNESSGFWKALEPSVADKGLRDLMGSIHEGLDKAILEKDASQLAFGSQMILDTVDLLEQNFQARYKTGTGALVLHPLWIDG